MRELVLISWLASTACGAGIDGDWFRCETSGCTQVADDGIRLRDDETFTRLDAHGATLDDGEPYCESNERSAIGTWAYDGALLTLNAMTGKTETVRFEPDGDRASMLVGDEALTWIRIAPRSMGACN
jgi:hypothetical protein